MVRPTSLGRPLAIRQGQFGFDELPVGDGDATPPVDLLDGATTDAVVETPVVPTGDPVVVDLNLLHGTVTDGGGNKTLSNPSYSNDGNALTAATNSAGTGSGTKTYKLTSDLGTGYPVTSVAIKVGGAGGSTEPTWTVEASNDGSTWASVTVTTDSWDSSTHTSTLSFTSLTRRYWRITRTLVLGGLAYIAAFSVYTWSIIGDDGSTDTEDDWVTAPEVQDADDATYHAVLDDTAGPAIVRAMLEADYRIGRSELLIGYVSSGSKTLDLYGATLADYSDETLIDSRTFTATGSYTGDSVTFLPDGTLGFTFYRIHGPNDCHIFTWELYAFEETAASTVEAELDAHLADTVDAHDASAVSVLDAGGLLTATDVEAALAELATDADAHLADTSDAHDASAISVVDAGGYFAGSTVEAVLAELGAAGSGPDVELVTVAATGSTETVDVSVARTYDLTLTANCTITLTGATTAEAWYLTLFLRQDGTGSRTVTWPGSLTWIGGSAPVLQTTAAAVDVVNLVTLDGGTNWIGAAGDASINTHLSDPTDAHDASAISIADAGSYFASTDVEGALQEIGAGGIGGGASGEDVDLLKDTASGTTQTIDCSVARLHDITLTAACALTITGASTGESHYVTIILRQDATGSRTVTWPAGVYWPGNVTPTLATTAHRADIFTLRTTDGGAQWYGYTVGAGYQLPAPSTGGSYWPLLALSSS